MEADSGRTEGGDRMNDDTQNDEGHRGSAHSSETGAKKRPRERARLGECTLSLRSTSCSFISPLRLLSLDHPRHSTAI